MRGGLGLQETKQGRGGGGGGKEHASKAQARAGSAEMQLFFIPSETRPGRSAETKVWNLQKPAARGGPVMSAATRLLSPTMAGGYIIMTREGGGGEAGG